MGMIPVGTEIWFTRDITGNKECGDPPGVLATKGDYGLVTVAADTGSFSYHVETDSGLTLRVFEGEIEVVS